MRKRDPRMTPVDLGDLVRDRVTGFEGIVTGMTRWLTGCDRAVVQSRVLHEGRPQMSESFDVMQLEILEKCVIQIEPQVTETATRTGGPRPTPEKRHV